MIIKNKNILLKKGFTLVELIIVITILAVLATIAFVSFQGYTKNARDATRLASMNSMSKGLEISLIKNSVLPHPETPVVIYDNSETIGYQGYFGDETARITGFDKTPKDPLDDKKYTYLTSSDYKKFQLLSLMETSDYLTLSNDLLPKTFADGTNYSKRIPKTIGDNLGVLLGTGASDMNRPAQEKLSASFTGINVDTSTSYKAIVSNSKSVSGSGITILKNTIKNSYNNSLIGYWDMETSYTGSDGKPYFKNLSGNGVDCLGDVLNSSTGGLKGNALVLNKLNTAAFLCRNLFTDKGPFTLFVTYKINQIYNEKNDNIDDLLLDKANSSGIFSIQGLSAGLLSYKIYNGSYNINKTITNQNKNLNREVNTTNWNITTLVYDGEKYKFYDDGKYMDFLDADSYITSNSVLFMPRGFTFSNKAFYGDLTLDDTKLYNKALDDNEIAKIYNQMK